MPFFIRVLTKPTIYTPVCYGAYLSRAMSTHLRIIKITLSRYTHITQRIYAWNATLKLYKIGKVKIDVYIRL